MDDKLVSIVVGAVLGALVLAGIGLAAEQFTESSWLHVGAVLGAGIGGIVGAIVG